MFLRRTDSYVFAMLMERSLKLGVTLHYHRRGGNTYIADGLTLQVLGHMLNVVLGDCIPARRLASKPVAPTPSSAAPASR